MVKAPRHLVSSALIFMVVRKSQSLTDAFWKLGYVVVQNLLNGEQLAFARNAMDASLRAGRLQPSKKGRVSDHALNEYSSIGAEAILLQCQPSIEAIVGRQLVPAYALWRIYKAGAKLRRHVDRNSCEISASLTISADPTDQLWPINVCDLQGDELAIPLPPAAGIVYQGCRVPHWREPFHGLHQYQIFLHYVIRDGDRAGYAFDRRDGLNIGTVDCESGRELRGK